MLFAPIVISCVSLNAHKLSPCVSYATLATLVCQKVPPHVKSGIVDKIKIHNESRTLRP